MVVTAQATGVRWYCKVLRSAKQIATLRETQIYNQLTHHPSNIYSLAIHCLFLKGIAVSFILPRATPKIQI